MKIKGLNVDNHQICLTCSVRQLAICAPLDEKAHQKLEDLMVHRRLKSGDVLFEESSKRDYVYSLTSGMIRLLKNLPDGRRYVTGFVLPGDFLGMIDDEYHIHTAEVISEAQICVFHGDALDEMMRANPMMREYFLKLTRDALKRAYDMQLILGRLSPVEKLARFLFDLKLRLHTNNLVSSKINLYMNRSDIADHLGLTIETVSRSFSKLKAQAIINLPTTSVVEILNVKQLIKTAGYSGYERDKIDTLLGLT